MITKQKKTPGRPPDFEAKISKASSNQIEAETALEIARKNQETVRQANQEIGHIYHPYNLETGEKQDSAKVSELLEFIFAIIFSATGALSDRCIKRVEKAQGTALVFFKDQVLA